MTAQQLQQFHRVRFCACGRKALRRVSGVGFCHRHKAQAVEAAIKQAVAWESAYAAKQFPYDVRQCVKRNYRYEAR